MLAGSLGVLVPFAAVAPPAEAEIYHYVDDEGTHHYTSYRVPGMQLIETFRDSSDRDDSRSRARSGASSPRRSGSSERSAPRRSYDHDAYDEIIREAAQEHGVPFAFVKAVIRAESAFNPRAVSRVGAQGLMQLMPGTAAELGVTDSFDPRQSIMGGTRLLAQLSERYDGDINLVLSAYNAGPGRVAQYQGIPYEATRRYIQTVYRYYQEYLAAEN